MILLGIRDTVELKPFRKAAADILRGALLTGAAVGLEVIHPGEIVGRGVIRERRIRRGIDTRAGGELRVQELALVFRPPGQELIGIRARNESRCACRRAGRVRIGSSAALSDEDRHVACLRVETTVCTARKYGVTGI